MKTIILWIIRMLYRMYGEHLARYGQLAEQQWRQAASAGVGRCGERLPGWRTAAAVNCALPAGHAGWHRSDQGTEWSTGQHLTSQKEARDG